MNATETSPAEAAVMLSHALRTPQAGEFEGAEVGLYTLLEKLGDGGFGSVWRAVQCEPVEREVALKIIKLGMDTLEVMSRFEQERVALSMMDHPNIAKVLDAGATPEGRPFFVMELVRGVPITAYCLEKALPLEQRLRLFKDVCSGVQHAHQKGIIHRDLKPSNILVAEIDGQPVPKIIDFGIAKAVSGEKLIDQTLRTRAEQMIGTPLYMSPEQADGSADIDTRSDVYALGVLLYEMLAGQPPFDAKTLMAAGYDEMRRIIREVEPRPPSSAESSVRPLGRQGSPERESTALPGRAKARELLSRDLDLITLRALAKDRTRRYESATAFAEDIQRFLNHEPVIARAPSFLYLTQRWVQRHRAATVAALICLLAIASGSALALWQAVRATQARGLAEANAYHATLANALAFRQRFDFGGARRLLAATDPTRRQLDWRLVKGLCRGDDTWSTSFGGSEPRCLALNPASGRVIVLTADRRLHDLDPASGQATPGPLVPVRAEVPGSDQITLGFRSLSVSPDGRYLACAEADAVMVLEAATGKLVHTQAGESMEAVWLDDHRLLHAIGSQRVLAPGQVSAFLYDVKTGQSTVLPASGITGPFALSQDRSRLALTRHGQRVEVHRLAAGLDGPAEAVVSSGGGRKNPVTSIHFSADATHLAVGWGFMDIGEVRVFAVGVPEPLFEHLQEAGRQLTVALCPEEPLLVVAGREPWLWTWRFTQPAGAVSAFQDGDPIAPGGPFDAPRRLLTRATQDQRTRYLFGHEAPVRQLLFLPGQRAFLTASSDGTVRRWPLASPVTPSQRWSGTKTLLEKWHPVASPDGMSIACLDADRLTQLWRRADNSRVTFPSGHEPLAALDDGRVLTRIGATGEVVMWQTQARDASAVEIWRASGVPSHPFYTAVIHSVLSRDGRRVAALLPGKLLVVDLDQRVARGTGNQRMIFGTVPGQTLDLSPDGQTLAVTGFLGHRVRLYRADDPAAGHVILTPASATAGSDSACAFSRDGRRLFVGNDDGWVRVFDLATRQELTGESWHAHTTAVTALAVSQQGAEIVTAARGTLILWPSASDGEPRRDILNFVVASTPAWVQWAGQDRTLLHAAPKQPLEAWETARD